ncbi:hypothetical protein HDK77DRAFT_182444 [Phyllosticta capitalensis]
MLCFLVSSFLPASSSGVVSSCVMSLNGPSQPSTSAATALQLLYRKTSYGKAARTAKIRRTLARTEASRHGEVGGHVMACVRNGRRRDGRRDQTDGTWRRSRSNTRGKRRKPVATVTTPTKTRTTRDRQAKRRRVQDLG